MPHHYSVLLQNKLCFCCLFFRTEVSWVMVGSVVQEGDGAVIHWSALMYLLTVQLFSTGSPARAWMRD